MAYLKPPFFVKNVFNRLAMAAGAFGTVTLSVPGRRSGSEQRIPVIPVEVDGRRHVVSTRGESEWVRNARHAGRITLRGKKTWAGTYAATEVPVAERGPIIAAYREAAGSTVTAYWKQLPDDADHPVFRLD